MNRSDLIYYPIADSTNKAMRGYIDTAYEGFTAVAGRQTAGRGRMGRSFVSPTGGLYMSVLLKPKKDNFALITAAAAVAVTEVLEKKFSAVCGIKWVNDIFAGQKKICGILAESVFNSDGTPKAVILGIGINLCQPENGFPDDIKDIAGNLEVFLTTDEKLDLAAEISERIVATYPHPETFVNIYRTKSIVIGKEINVIKNGVAVRAKALDIDNECGLVVDYGESTDILRTGEISVRII